MWISKKKWNEMQNEINNIKNYRLQLLENKVNKLVDAHNEIEVEEEFEVYSIIGIKTEKRVVSKYTHSSDTNIVPNVTLEELTKLVIDGTPIERKENVEMTSKFYRR